MVEMFKRLLMCMILMKSGCNLFGMDSFIGKRKYDLTCTQSCVKLCSQDKTSNAMIIVVPSTSKNKRPIDQISWTQTSHSVTLSQAYDKIKSDI